MYCGLFCLWSDEEVWEASTSCKKHQQWNIALRCLWPWQHLFFHKLLMCQTSCLFLPSFQLTRPFEHFYIYHDFTIFSHTLPVPHTDLSVSQLQKQIHSTWCCDPDHISVTLCKRTGSERGARKHFSNWQRLWWQMSHLWSNTYCLHAVRYGGQKWLNDKCIYIYKNNEINNWIHK